MQAVILAGGLGTRLRSVIPDLPKCMADIAGKPFLVYLLQLLQESGIKNILLLTGYMHEAVETYFGNGNQFGVSIAYSRETKPLGTGGALMNAWPQLSEQFVLINGDTFFDVEFELLLNYSKEQQRAAVMALRFSEEVSRYGAVHCDVNYTVQRFVEKGTLPADQVDAFINGGIYYFEKRILQSLYLEWQGQLVSLENEYLPALIACQELSGLPMGGKFIDIGIPDSYAQAQYEIPEWLERPRQPVLFLDRDGVLIRDTHYVFGRNLDFLETGAHLVRHAHALNQSVIVVSNQAGVAKGYFEESNVLDTHAYISQVFQENGTPIKHFLYCPFHSEGCVDAYRKRSLCRKPEPGMLLKAAELERIDFKNSAMWGDNPLVDRIKLPYLSCQIIPQALTRSI